MQLRQEVFIVEQNCPYLDADGKDFHSYHVLGEKANQVLAYTRLVPPGVSYKDYSSIGRVTNHISLRRTGEGQRLMEFSIAKTKDLWPNHSIKISAQCYLMKFYNKLGFFEVGDEYLEDDIPHIAMLLQ